MKIFSILFILASFGLLAASATYPISSFAPFFRYRYHNARDHFYTTNPSEIGTITIGKAGKHGYIFEGIECALLTRHLDGSIPLYRYYSGRAHDHFYTTNAREIGVSPYGTKVKYNYVNEGVAGYCYQSRFNGAIPLHRYWNPRLQNHFYTTNAKEIGTTTLRRSKKGYTYEGIACYVPKYQPVN